MERDDIRMQSRKFKQVKHSFITFISTLHSSAQIFNRSSTKFFCADATYTSVSVVLRFSFAALASKIENTLSTPMLTPTHGTLRPFASNIPTKSSYRPPPATLPTPTGSSEAPVGTAEEPLDLNKAVSKPRDLRDASFFCSS